MDEVDLVAGTAHDPDAGPAARDRGGQAVGVVREATAPGFPRATRGIVRPWLARVVIRIGEWGGVIANLHRLGKDERRLQPRMGVVDQRHRGRAQPGRARAFHCAGRRRGPPQRGRHRQHVTRCARDAPGERRHLVEDSVEIGVDRRQRRCDDRAVELEGRGDVDRGWCRRATGGR